MAGSQAGETGPGEDIAMDATVATTAGDNTQPRLLIPAMRGFYDRAADASYLIIRLTAGLMLLPHGLPKIFEQGISAFAAAGLARRGIEPALPLAYVIVLNETIGAVMLAAGFLTRIVAVSVAIEMAVIAWTYVPKFGWTGPGYEYALMWGLIAVAIALRGGGPYSVDRKLGWEV
jgi:putative oxidoreductase